MTCPARHTHNPRAARFFREARGFTLIELILVMALLTVVISLTAPKLSRFFRGRTLDSEARRLLALTRSGQSRAVSEGMPMDLWVNSEDGQIGLEAEPSFETADPKAVDFRIDERLKIEVGVQATPLPTVPLSRNRVARVASVQRVQLAHAGLPTIRFLPDGSVGQTSPQELRLIGADGESLWVALARDGLSYEIRTTPKQSGENTPSAEAAGP